MLAVEGRVARGEEHDSVVACGGDELTVAYGESAALSFAHAL